MTKNNFADLLIVVMHKHAALQKEFFDHKQRSMYGLNCTSSDLLNSFLIYSCLPCQAHILVAFSNDLKASTDGLCSSLSDQEPWVSEADPYQLKYHGNISV